jgi:hypothetical protein
MHMTTTIGIVKLGRMLMREHSIAMNPLNG